MQIIRRRRWHAYLRSSRFMAQGASIWQSSSAKSVIDAKFAQCNNETVVVSGRLGKKPYREG
jgi:hypothetical protein